MKTFRQLSAAGAALLLVGALVALPSVAYATDEAVDSAVTSEVTPIEAPTSDSTADSSPDASTKEDVVEEEVVYDTPVATPSDSPSEAEETSTGPTDTTDSSSSTPAQGIEEGEAPVVAAPAPPVTSTPDVSDTAGQPELEIFNLELDPRRLSVPSISVDFGFRPNADPSTWQTPGLSNIDTLVFDSNGTLVGNATLERVIAGGASYTFFLDPGDYTLQIVVQVTGGGTTIAREEPFTIPAPPVDSINVPAPQQDGNTVVVNPAPEGSEYYNVDTGETVPGSFDLLETGKVTLDARPTGARPVQTNGPWTYIPVLTVVTPTWPVQKGNTVPFVPQPGVIFTDAKDGSVLTGDVSIPKGGREVKRTPDKGYVFPEGTDTKKTYNYIKPVPGKNEVTPVFPKQEEGSNRIPFLPQKGVIFTDVDGTIIEGLYTVTPGKETVFAAPDTANGFVFTKDAQPEKTYEYFKPVPTEPTPGPTSSPVASPSPSSSQAPAASGNTSVQGGDTSGTHDALAVTGSNVNLVWSLLGAFVLIAVGAGTFLFRRRA